MITQFTEVLHRLGIKTVLNRKHRTNPPSRPQATNGSGPVARRDPAAQAGRRPQTAESPIETRCPTRVSIKPSFQSASADAQFPCAPSALMENQPYGLVFPSPTVRSMPSFELPQFGQRSWNPFPWNGFPYPRPYCAPSSLSDRTLGKVQRKRPSRRTVFS